MSKLKAGIYASLTVLLCILIIIAFCIEPNATLAVIIVAGVLGYIWYLSYINFTKKSKE